MILIFDDIFELTVISSCPESGTLKIHMEETYLLNFLRKLDIILCEQIVELDIATKGYTCRDPELNFPYEVMNILLPKFKNLRWPHFVDYID